MKNSDIQFDGDLLKELILSNFGSNAITAFCAESKISKTTLYGWLNGNSKSGPRGESWTKIVHTFSKKGVEIVVSDFYKSKTNSNKPYSIGFDSTVSESNMPYKRTIKNNSADVNQLIAEKNQIIVDQYQEILSLRKEIEELKKRLNKT